MDQERHSHEDGYCERCRSREQTKHERQTAEDFDETGQCRKDDARTHTQ
jgi:hypothetical protein